MTARPERCVWLDGGARPGWRQPVLAICEPEDPSLTWDGSYVTRHAAGRSEIVGTDIFQALAAELAAGPEDADWYGWFGYASRTDLPARRGRIAPEAVWMRPSRIEAPPAPLTPLVVTPNVGVPEVPNWYTQAFDAVQERLRAGDSYEVNLTTRFDGTSTSDPWQVMDRLRATNAAPWSGLVAHDVAGYRGWLVSSSPEQYLSLHNRRLRTRPIKGTAPRGFTADQDEAIVAELARDEKIRAENLMITDLLRNDVAMVSEPGTVTVPELMAIESYPAVHQVVTTIEGLLRPEFSVLDAVHALFPPGSMTGAPKLRTMQVIDEVEATPRGVYSGVYGRISGTEADLAVVIRSLVTDGSGRWEWGTGGGVTVDSTAASEWAELCWKSARVGAALAD